MKIVEKLLRRQLIHPEIKRSVIAGRGNINEDFPSDFSDEEKENVRLVQTQTMTSVERLVSLSRSVDYVVKNRIEGDIVECGVWRGGSMMLVAKRLMQLNERQKKLFLFDTFEGMSSPDEHDVDALNHISADQLLNDSDKTKGDNVWCYSPLEEVKSNLGKTGYPSENIFYFKGKVEDTLPEPSISTIAILRLDTDWYSSTKHELELLYDQLVPGGVLIIDDYGHWSGSKKAVDEFIGSRNLKLFLNRIDYTGRLAIKP